MFTKIKDILANDPTAESYFAEGTNVFKRGVKDNFLARLPKLPSEPEYDLTAEEIAAGRSNKNHDPKPEEVPIDVKEPVFLSNGDGDDDGISLYYCAIDGWYPSNNAMKREKRRFKADNRVVASVPLPDGEKFGMTASMKERLSKTSEPGAIEKLPHCKVHAKMFQAQYGKLSKEPLFCCQVSEVYCKSVMVCCSICSTWRHAECGGHHEFYSPQKAEADFVPICNLCYREKPILEKFPQCEKRLARQRNIHLRKTLAAADVMRHA
eukprot:8852719-Ditylum_brightwellii.AAC.1